MKALADPMVRFLAKVNKTASCWLWTGHSYDGRYGGCHFRGRTRRAHRVSWELHRGPIPPGLLVLHNCPDGDNPACVNPDHLWLGTNDENMADMVAKGRAQKGRPDNCGATHPNAKLTEEEVREIRQLHTTGISQSELGRRFGVDHRNIHLIVHRKAWRHVP